MLKLEHVKKAYVEPDGARLPIIDVPTFALGEAEQCVLLGQSGSGKTTLLHIIAGIRTPDSGKVLLDGVDVARLREAARDRFRAEKIGYVFQTFNLLAAFTALENVLLGMTFGSGKVDRQRALDLLGRVGLSHRLHHVPAKLSVGEQQRVAVARALANKPRLLLADEPTANVDAKHQDQVIELIRQSCREDKVGLLMVTHSTTVADQFSRVVRLEDFNTAMKPTGVTV